MKALVAYTIKSLRTNKVRTFVTVAGVVLAAALLTAVLSTFTSLTNFLRETEIESSGSWGVAITQNYSPSFQEELASAEESGDLGSTAALQNVGFGQLTTKQRNYFGAYMPLQTFSGNPEELCGLGLTEGRMPQSSDEILLFDTWKSREGLKVGDTFTLSVGKRVARLSEGEAGSQSWGMVDAATNEPIDGGAIEDGTELGLNIGYLSPGDGGKFSEELVDIQERTFTVVGFYSRWNGVSSYSVGRIGLTCQEFSEGLSTTVYATTAPASTSTELRERVQDLFPQAESVSLHLSLLRYEGVASHGDIWNTFFGIAAILAVVIIAVCIALIYNAFSISVAERMSQFALLKSIGASHKQLHRSVMLEALLIALMGIPLGLLIGIGGTYVTLRILGPSIATVIGNPDMELGLYLIPMDLVVTAILTLVTVLISAFIPAWRCGRTDIIQALRGAQIRLSSAKGARDALKNTDPSRLWKIRGFAGRLFGVGGTLARINKKRGVSKGAMASISLALAILLLMTAGSLNTFLGTLVNAADDDIGVDAKINMSIDFQPSQAADVLVRYEEAYESLSAVSGTQPCGWNLGQTIPLIFPKAMLGTTLNDSAATGSEGILADGSFGCVGSITFVDDVTFDTYMQEQGQDPAPYHDPTHLSAIAVGNAYGNNGQKYEILDYLRQPGIVRVLAGGTIDNTPLAGFSLGYDKDDGLLSFEPYVRDKEGSIAPAVGNDIRIDEFEIDVAYIASESIPGISASRLSLLMPVSVASDVYDTLTLDKVFPNFAAGFNVEEEDHYVVIEELTKIANECFSDSDEYEFGYVSVSDIWEQGRTTRMLATIVNVFCFLFTGILALIAMANVFNTITNSLTLRRQEFAVMQSAGMASRQLHKMVAEECVSFGIRGFLPGMLISLVVSFLIYSAIGQSISGLSFVFPWNYVALAIAMTLVAMLAAVAFGMHRCKANNLVEALRNTSI